MTGKKGADVCVVAEVKGSRSRENFESYGRKLMAGFKDFFRGMEGKKWMGGWERRVRMK